MNMENVMQLVHKVQDIFVSKFNTVLLVNSSSFRVVAGLKCHLRSFHIDSDELLHEVLLDPPEPIIPSPATFLGATNR